MTARRFCYLLSLGERNATNFTVVNLQSQTIVHDELLTRAHFSLKQYILPKTMSASGQRPKRFDQISESVL
jgi:hypothetical protein